MLERTELNVKFVRPAQFVEVPQPPEATTEPLFAGKLSKFRLASNPVELYGFLLKTQTPSL